MFMPDVHSCSQVLSENEKLKRYLKKLKRDNEDLRKEIEELKEEKKIKTLLKEYVTTRNMEVQTESNRPHSYAQPPKPKTEKIPDASERLNKMITLHNNLMKRYEKELKANMENVDTIAELNVQVNGLEQKLKEAKCECEKLEREKKRRCWGQKVTEGHSPTDLDPDIAGLLQELNKVRKERDKYYKQNKKFKAELEGLDKGFFDEVEDIKFALQQSISLNKEYEKSLRKMSARFGVPYPDVEAKVLSARR